MTKIKNKILIGFLVASTPIFAEYQVKIHLEKDNVNFEDASISGSASLTPETINRGDTSILSWNYQYADEVNIEGLGTYAASGSLSLSPLTTTTYKINAVNSNDDISDTLTLTVLQPNPNINFTSNSYRIGVGTSAELSWNVSNSTSVNIDNGIGTGLNTSGTYTISPTNDTTYTLVANGYEGITGQANLTIDVVPNSIISNFTSDRLNVTVGDTVNFYWNVSDTEALELLPYGVLNKSQTNQSVLQNSIGSISYSLKTTSLSGVTSQSSPITINTYGVPEITDFTVNGLTNINVEANDPLTFNWIGNNISKYTLDGSIVNGNTSNLNAPSTDGLKSYQIIGENEAGRSVTQSVSVNVVGVGSINTFTSPNTVFANAPFNLNWTTTNLTDLKISSTTGSGINNEINVTGNTQAVTPTSAGTYVYTLKGKNLADKESTGTKNVTVESDPTFTGFTVNGETSITVSPSAALSFVGTGYSSGATLQGRNSGNTANSTLPSSASATAGSTTYYASATKTLNNVTKYSTLRSVVITVVEGPTIGTITSPTNVFTNSAFTMSWTGTNATSYSIRGNVAASGVATTDVDLGTTTSRSITPTAAGTYTYTITATNAAGVTTTSTRTVTVEADPTFTGYTVNGSTAISVSPSEALSYAISGNSSGSTIVDRNSGNTANATNPTTANSSAGTSTYYAAVTKTLNGISRYSAVRSVSVTVVDAPTIGTITSPATVFANAAFSSSWTGTNVSNYTIRGNVAASGVSTTDVDLNTTASRSITPTAAGTYTYTITATNSVGVETTKTFSVTVVADPTISAFSASPTTLTVGATTTFSWTSANNGTLSINQGVGTVTGTSKAYVTTTAGTIVYTLTNSRVLNSVTRSATRTVTLTINSAKVCDWKTTAPVTMWTYVNGGMNPWQSSQYVYWNGATVFSSTGNPVFQTSFTNGGYQYTLTQSPATLCRQAI